MTDAVFLEESQSALPGRGCSFPDNIHQRKATTSNGLASLENIKQCIHGAKPPLPSKSRGRPKKFRCNGAPVAAISRESVLSHVISEDVNIKDVLCTRQITEETLHPAILQFSWICYRQFFTESAFLQLQAKLETLCTLVNTCQVCMVAYDKIAPMVGCDSCGYWFHWFLWNYGAI